MKSMKNPFAGLKFGRLAPLALLGLVLAPHARADTMLLSDTTMVTGSESAVFSFSAPTAGTVTATLQNQSWPTPLSALSFAATSASSVISAWSAPVIQAESFQVGAGTYFAHVNATASGPLDLGLFSLNLSFVPAGTVPLPSSDWMLLGATLGLFGLIRASSAFASFERFRDGMRLQA
jgi:hypothetical protein